ncbi:histidine phosphatase family protein, partial [Rhizobium ruizarguesonis]
DATSPIAFVGHGGVGTLLKCHRAGSPITRDRDQPGGGGNLYAFGLAARGLTCDWTPIEDWQG